MDISFDLLCSWLVSVSCDFRYILLSKITNINNIHATTGRYVKYYIFCISVTTHVLCIKCAQSPLQQHFISSYSDCITSRRQSESPHNKQLVRLKTDTQISMTKLWMPSYHGWRHHYLLTRMSNEAIDDVTVPVVTPHWYTTQICPMVCITYPAQK